jgi:hypothetical protein
MSIPRQNRTYGERTEGRVFTGLDVSEPQEGYWRYRLGSGQPFIGIRIVFGPPLDPYTGEEIDRGWRWQVEIQGDRYLPTGESHDFNRHWPACAQPENVITEAEYHGYIAKQRWAREHAPNSSYAELGRKRDLLSLSEPMPF